MRSAPIFADQTSRSLLVLLIAMAATAPCGVRASEATPPPRCAAGPLQVPSPDWRDQIMYLAMIDRFDDGDPSNNDQGANEYDPADGRRYSGGDLAGLLRRVDYLRALGITALWVTPPVANQWWDARHRYGGYHGYWAEDFMRIDAHFGDLADYRALARCLHANDMRLVQDIVVNHVGNFFRYDGAIDADDPSRNFHINENARPHSAPTRYPFSLNDARRRRDRKAAIYHWTPDIVDFGDTQQLQTWQLAGLDDLNTDNPLVRRALRQSYGYWIREAGVDAYRIDTAFYVPPEYFEDFLYADDRRAPGILNVARQNGRKDFLAFGEGFAMDTPFHDESARRIDRYLRDAQGKPRLPGMLNFPLYGSTLDVFARGRPTSVLAHRIRSMLRIHTDPFRMPSFVDNHDVDRFLAVGDEAGLKQALFLIMTLPGIPVIYYGTEQGFTMQRAAMFAGGFGANGRDHFDREAPLFRYLQRVIALRREHPVLAHERPVVLADNAAAPGALAYRVGTGADALLVVINSSDRETLLDAVETGFVANAVLEPVFAIGDQGVEARVDQQGRLTRVLPPRSGQVWRATKASTASTSESLAKIGASLDPIAERTSDDRLRVSGRADGVRSLRVVVDGDIKASVVVAVGTDGRWQTDLDTSSFVDPEVRHRVVAWSQEPIAVSAARTFSVDRQWRERIRSDDPEGDDRGPDGHYRYPTDPLWEAQRPLDLCGVDVETSGGSLRITVHMRNLVATWNPPNGFDHLALTAYLELPGRSDGARVMPLQNAELPDGMRWHARLRVGGWSTALTGHASASASSEGPVLTPGAAFEVDRARATVRMTIPARALGDPATLEGARLYVTTWDYDGGYRELADEAGANQFGGGKHDGPRIMDASAIITIPASH